MIIDCILNNVPDYPLQINPSPAIIEKYTPSPSNLTLTIPDNNNNNAINYNSNFKNKLPKETFNRQYCPPILDQERQNSCSANAVTYMIEYYQKRNLSFTTSLSAEALYYWTRELEGSTNKDVGVFSSDTFDIVKDIGIPSEKYHSNSRSNEFVNPSNISIKDAFLNKIDGWKQLDFSGNVKKSDIIAKQLFKGNVVGMCIFENNNLYYPPSDGIVDIDLNNPLLKSGHEMMVVDYKTDEAGRRIFLCENSWGKNYGIQPEGVNSRGYIWLTENYIEKGCYFAGTIEFGKMNSVINLVVKYRKT